MKPEQLLADRIAKTFPKLDPSSEGFLPSATKPDEIFALRLNIHRVQKDYLAACMGLIMYNLCTMSVVDEQPDESADNVVAFLDASFDIPTQPEGFRDFCESFKISDEESQRVYAANEEKRHYFESFSKEQAQIIYEWLRLAEHQPYLSQSAIHLKGAQRFWGMKAGLIPEI